LSLFVPLSIVAGNQNWCPWKCEYQHTLCVDGQCAFVPLADKKACTEKCADTKTACKMDCQKTDRKCVDERRGCESQCSPIILKNRDKCMSQCDLRYQCCTRNQPTKLGNNCGNACSMQDEQCEAPCLFMPLTVRMACIQKCRATASTCEDKCRKIEDGCSTGRLQCEESCPISLKTRCQKLCDLDYKCCSSFPNSKLAELENGDVLV